MLVPQELSMIVSSDPNNGAVNSSSDGSYFEIQLQDGLALPAEALNATLSVEEATVWWTVPNIITGKNDKMYITGTAAEPLITSRTSLGFPVPSTFSMTIVSPNVSTLNISNIASGMPIGAFLVGDKFRIDDPLSISYNVEYTITVITTDLVNTKTYTVSGLLEGNIVSNNGEFSRLRYNTVNNYILTIPQGLYDLNGLNQAILRELENAGAKIDPNPLLSFSPDEPTSRVEMRINYTTVLVDFTQVDTPRTILGFESLIYGTYITAPINILAPNVAAFNTVNYFLIHSDLTNKGIRFNNNYNQTIAQVLIDVSPGRQIVSRPFNPARIPVNELVGAKRNNIRMWLTDDNDNRVFTNNEYWTARIVIRYLKPYVIGNENVRK
jgi:hypothetical protein